MSAPVLEEVWPMRGRLSRGGTHYILTEPSSSSGGSSSKGLVVMIHGLGSWSYNYDGMAEYMSSQGYRTLQLDNIGMGHSKNAPLDIDDLFSPKHSATFNGTAHINNVHELLSELGLLGEPYIVVGHSMGGALATLYAERYASEVKAIILLSPSGVQSAWQGKAISISLMRSVVPNCLLPSLLNMVTKDAGSIDNIRNFGDFIDKESPASEASCLAIYEQHQHNKQAIKCFFNCVRFFPFFTLHKSVRAVAMNGIPVLLLHGSEDDTIPPSPTMEIWSDAISARKASPLAEGETQGAGASASRVLLVKGAHMFFLEDPAVTHAIMSEWLAELGPSE